MILRELAVEPGVMADFYRCAYVLDQMGFPFGRMISGFPKWSDWKDLVITACRDADVADVEKKRILERVKRGKTKFVPTSRTYRKNASWVSNVRDQYPRLPFDAIIALRDEPDLEPCLVIGEFFEDDPNWDVPRGFAIDRTAAKIAEVIAPLVVNSREVVFVDPYFDPASSDWRNPLREVLFAATRNGHVLRRCEFHLKVVKDRGGPLYDTATFAQICAEHLPAVLPPDLELTLLRWEQLTEGERLHPRYILTELGGISFEGGLDEGKAGESTDAAILEPAILERRWADYHLDSSTFRLAQDPVVVVGAS